MESKHPLYDHLKPLLEKDGKVDMDKVVHAVAEGVSYLSGDELDGAAKKALIIDVIHQIMDDTESPMDAFEPILKPLIGATIDKFLVVRRNRLRLRMPRLWCRRGHHQD
jgi:hypothetical protein